MKIGVSIICFKTGFLIELATIINNQFEETTTTNNKTNTMDAASWHDLVHDVIVSNLNLFIIMHELASD